MEFTEFVNALLLKGDLNKLLEKEYLLYHVIKNKYYKCDEQLIIEENGILIGEPLRYLLINMGVDPLNIEIDEEKGFALLYHHSSKIFKVKICAGNKKTPYSIYKDYFFDFNSVQEIYSEH